MFLLSQRILGGKIEMKKSIKKTINYLKQYIGCTIIRSKPSITGKKDYTNTPIILLGFTSDGKIRYKRGNPNMFLGVNSDGKAITYTNRIMSYISGDKEYILPLEFTDRYWISYRKYWRSEKEFYEHVVNNPNKYMWAHGNRFN